MRSASFTRNLLRSVPVLIAILFAGAGVSFLIAQEPPVGSVQGRVSMSENRLPLSGVEIHLQPTEGFRAGDARHTRSLKDGTFALNRVPSGHYLLTAHSAAHHTKQPNNDPTKLILVNVDEGQITPVDVVVEKSEPELLLHQGQVIFATDEKAKLGITGYSGTRFTHEADSVHVSVWKTRLSRVLQNKNSSRDLDSIARGYDHAKTIPTTMLQPASGDAPKQILNIDSRITEADHEGFFHKRYALDPMPTGLYLVQVTHSGLTDCTWLMVTNTALVLKRAHSRLTAFTVDMRSGVPLPQIDVRAYRDGRVVAGGRTDGNGITEFDVPQPQKKKRINHSGQPIDPADDSGDTDDSANSVPESQQITTIAVRGDDEAVVTRDYYRNEDSGGYKIHSYTDRPVYRPGQRIYFKDIVRKSTPSNGSSAASTGLAHYVVPSNAEVGIEFRDPGGERLMKVTAKTDADGCYNGQVDLDKETPTGVYSLITTVDGEVHTHDVVIASYRKPEFTSSVTAGKVRYVRGETVTMTVSADYYFGAPVAGAKVDYHVYREADYVPRNRSGSDEDSSSDSDDDDTADSEDQSFESERGYYGEEVTHGSCILDQDGKAVVSFKADAPQDPEGPQKDKYTLSATIKEGEDNEVSAEGAAHVTTGDFDLTAIAEGSLASPGQPDSVLIHTRDADGKPVPGVTVEVETGYHHWSSEDDVYSYDKVSTSRLTLNAQGSGIYALVAPREGELEIKVRAWDFHGNKIVARSSVWVAGDSGGALDTQYADLSIHADKRHYSPGDVARVLVNSVRIGQSVLLTVEGERVYSTQVVPLTGKSKIVRIPILASYGPNVFLGACYVRDKKFATSELPLRVSIPSRQLKVSITPDREAQAKPTTRKSDPDALPRYQPADPISYRIHTTDAEGKPVPADLSFGVVDEAIYDIMEDVPGALRDEFYPKRGNDVDTEYSFSIAFMGDADKSEPQMVTRKKFPDTAYWNANVHTDARGDATIHFTLPDNLTTWRATATAVTLDTRVGRATENVVVSKDFLVRLEAPRFLTQKDKSRFITDVHNDTGAQQAITVRLQTEKLTIDGNTTQNVTLESGGHADLVWPITASATETGDARVVVKAWTAHTATGRQYTDGLENTLPVLPHGREIVNANAGSISSAKSQTETMEVTSDSIAGSQRLTVRVTPSIAGALLGASDYLTGYPYGCTEQTMSRFMPDLLVAHALKTCGMGAVPNQDKLPQMVRNGLLRLGRFQHEKTGAWGWWEHDEADPWMTAYVLFGLSRAASEGYTVSPHMLQRGRQAAVEMLHSAKMSLSTRVFLMYALAMAGNLEVPRGEAALLKFTDLDTEAIAYLVLLDKRIGDSSQLAMAMNELEKRSIFGDSMIHWSRNGEQYYWDGDDIQTTTVALRALIAVDPGDPRIEPVLRWLMYRRTGNYWTSTRDTAWSLVALTDYLTATHVTAPDATNEQVVLSINGTVAQTFVLNADARKERELVYRAPGSLLHGGANHVTLAHVGGSASVFYSVELKQTVGAEDMKAIAPVMPITSHLGAAPASTGIKDGDPKNLLVVSREYRRLVPYRSGYDSWQKETQPTNDQLTEGEMIRVRLTITAPRNMEFVLLEDPFPAGLEVTERGEADEMTEWGNWYSSIDIRDSKVAFFMRKVPVGTSVIEYNLRAKTHGSYHAMPAFLQAMYSPDMHAESAEDRVMVR